MRCWHTPPAVFFPSGALSPLPSRSLCLAHSSVFCFLPQHMHMFFFYFIYFILGDRNYTQTANAKLCHVVVLEIDIIYILFAHSNTA